MHDLHPLGLAITDSLLRSIFKPDHEGFFLLDASAYLNAHFGQGTSPILLDVVACVGNEARLVDCRYTTTPNCIHGEDAGVSCKTECK